MTQNNEEMSTEEFDIKSPRATFFYTCIKEMKLPKDKATETIKVGPFGKKYTEYKIEGFQISDWYDSLKRTSCSHDVTKWKDLDGNKKIEGTMTVSELADDHDGYSRAVLTLKYERISSDIEHPDSIMKTFINFAMKIDMLMNVATK